MSKILRAAATIISTCFAAASILASFREPEVNAPIASDHARCGPKAVATQCRPRYRVKAV
jgi:hypothetical protein